MKIKEPNFSKNKVIDKNLIINICPRSKVQHIAEITALKAEKYLSEGRKLGSTCLLACLPPRFVSTKKIFHVSLLKSVLSRTIYLTWY